MSMRFAKEYQSMTMSLYVTLNQGLRKAISIRCTTEWKRNI